MTALVPDQAASADDFPRKGALLPRGRSDRRPEGAGIAEDLRLEQPSARYEPQAGAAGADLTGWTLPEEPAPTGPTVSEPVEPAPPIAVGGWLAPPEDAGGDWADVLWGATSTVPTGPAHRLRPLPETAPPEPTDLDETDDEAVDPPWMHEGWLDFEQPPPVGEAGEQEEFEEEEEEAPAAVRAPLIWPPLPEAAATTDAAAAPAAPAAGDVIVRTATKGRSIKRRTGPKRSGPLVWVRRQFSERLVLMLVICVVLGGVAVGTVEQLAGHSAASAPAGDNPYAVGPCAPNCGNGPASHKSSHKHTTKAANPPPAHKQQPPPATTPASTTTSTSTTTTTVVAPVNLLTPSVAQSAFASTWPAFASAANSGSAGALSSVATSGAVQVALANSLSSGGAWPSSASAVISAPAETAYPLSFAAQTGGALAVLERFSPSSPWQVAWAVNSNTEALAGGTGAAAPQIGSGALSGPISELAQALQSLRSTGKAPAGNLWDSEVTGGGALGTLGTSLATDYQASIADQRHDVVTYSVGSYSPVFSAQGGYLMCGEIDAQTVETPSKGGVLVQPPDRSSYGPTLAPGNYHSITASATRDACVSVSSGGAVALAGLTGGLYTVSGNAG